MSDMKIAIKNIKHVIHEIEKIHDYKFLPQEHITPHLSKAIGEMMEAYIICARHDEYRSLIDARQANDVATQATNGEDMGADTTTKEKIACEAIVTDGNEGMKYDTAKARYDLIPTELYEVPWADICGNTYFGLIKFWHRHEDVLFRLLCMIKADIENADGDFYAALASVYGYGASVYGDRNWERGMAWSRLYNAAMRHGNARACGSEHDSESGLPHLWHEAWNVATLYVYQLRRIGTDDRPGLRYGEGEGHD